MTLPVHHRYVPYAEAAKVDNIVVDGGANEHTALALSHWPKSGTPNALKADTSVEIVYRYLDDASAHKPVEVVTNDHFDEDGLIALFVIIDPETALANRELLCDASHAGDFATYRSRQAARIAFTFAALANKETSTLPPEAFPDDYMALCAELYTRLIPMVADVAVNTDDYRSLWQAEEALLDDSEAGIERGEIKLEEHKDADLVVVRIPATWRERPAHQFTQDRQVLCHPMAIHNRTPCNRVATVCGQRLWFGYRYESWVQKVNDPPPARRDLKALAETLTAMEGGAATWQFDGVEQITPALHLTNAVESTIDPDQFVTLIADALTTGAPAWDPYD
ncbi:MAG: DUF6687 family protein [Pseudomonadota bacterium]